MNINQAKAVAGIPRGQSVAGRQRLLVAIERCKRGIVAAHPDRGGESALAAKLSEAQQVFKDRLRGNRCEVCGVRIAETATRCRLHQKKRALPGAAEPGPAETKPERWKLTRRMDVSPEGGWLARYGFYSRPVQAVVRKWGGKVSASRLQHYFATIAETMIRRPKPMALTFGYVGPNDWPCIFQLGIALDEVLADKTKPDSWLIRNPIWVATHGSQEDWADMAARSGFKANTLNQAARRLRMLTPKPVQESYRRAVRTLTKKS